ncbi:MAG TPA: lysoplasmalogenase family protein [Caldilineaceae bacterium]|nr:lysoplasmalogenase family protein [Caldilineaceae bacterium]
MTYTYLLLALTVVLSIGAGVLAFLAYRNDIENATHYHLLAGFAILLVACIVPTPLTLPYKAAIVLGLLLVLVGTVLHRLLRLPLAVAQTFDLITILLFAAAFASLHPLKWPTPWLLLLVLVGGGFYEGIQPKLAELKGTIALYLVALLLMSWQALEVLVTAPALWSWLIVGGVLSLVAAKLLAVVHYGYHAESSIYDATARRRTTQEPAWLQRLLAKHTLSQRLWQWLRRVSERGQQLATQLLEWLQLPKLARKSALVLPLILLLWQWLTALSIWGPSLATLVAR